MNLAKVNDIINDALLVLIPLVFIGLFAVANKIILDGLGKSDE